VRVGGVIDFDTAPQLERTLRQAELRSRLIVLDLRGLSSIDIAAVHVIVYAETHARRTGRRLVLVRGAPQVDHVFDLTGASEVLEIVDLERAAPAIQVVLQLAHSDDAA
jgi:anti-anti-sigma factor